MPKRLKKLNTQDKPKNFVCARCMSTYPSNYFYSFPTFPAKLAPVCKECMYAFAIRSNGLFREGLIDLCKYLDLPFFQNFFEEVAGKKVTPKWQVSQYFNKLRINKDVHNLHFKDSIFEIIDDFDSLHGEQPEVVDLSESFKAGELETDEERITKERKSKKQMLEQLQLKWGKYTSLEYMQRCEELYQEIVQGGYIIRSSMHDISVRNYCKIQVKWDIAQESDNYEAMKELKQPLKDARTDAKLNPSQLKAEDFSTGGANSFSEIARMVAKRDGFIPFPMKYYKQPQDALDFLMYEIVNYDRHVLGLPEAPYEELYHHYVDRVNAFNEKYSADIENGDLGDLDPSTRGKKKEYKLI